MYIQEVFRQAALKARGFYAPNAIPEYLIPDTPALRAMNSAHQKGSKIRKRYGRNRLAYRNR
jgi:hypothetical protein